MTTVIKQQLTKVCNDLIGNRNNLASQIEASELQLSHNRDQLAHFDAVIASVKATLADDDILETALSTLGDPSLMLPIVVEEAPPAPLAPAAGTEVAPAAPSAIGGTGTDANGSPVAVDTVAAG